MATARKKLLIEVVSAAYPAFIDSMPIGRWQVINLNRPSDVDPEDNPALNPNYPANAPWHQGMGQEGVFRVWNGAVFASRVGTYGSVIHYGGGHNAYAGSELLRFDIATRLWSLLTNPFPGPINFPYATGVYPDGSPIPPHTYDTLVYHEASNRLVKMRSCTESTSTSSNSVEAPYFQNFNFDTGVWTNMGPHTGVVHSGGFSCYDPLRQVCWGSGGSASDGFFKVDPVTGIITKYNTKHVMTDSAAAYDPINDLFVVTGFRNDTRVRAWSLAGDINANGMVWLNDTGVAFSRQSAHGWEWSPAKQGFIYYRRNGQVLLFKHTSGSWNAGTWTWSVLTDPGNTVIPPDNDVDNGVYSKMQLASYVNGQREILVMCNSAAQDTYGFRIA